MEQINTKCKECEKAFYITPDEQKFYAEKEFSLPKRCFNCRQKRREHKKGTRTFSK